MSHTMHDARTRRQWRTWQPLHWAEHNYITFLGYHCFMTKQRQQILPLKLSRGNRCSTVQRVDKTGSNTPFSRLLLLLTKPCTLGFQCQPPQMSSIERDGNCMPHTMYKHLRLMNLCSYLSHRYHAAGPTHNEIHLMRGLWLQQVLHSASIALFCKRLMQKLQKHTSANALTASAPRKHSSTMSHRLWCTAQHTYQGGICQNTTT